MRKPNLLILGAGGVGGVTAHKAAQNSQWFGTITLASRTLAKAQAIADDVSARGHGSIDARQVDAQNQAELERVALQKLLRALERAGAR